MNRSVQETVNLVVTPVDYENKFPAHMEQTPTDSTPIQHPNPSDNLFGRGGLTNHHEVVTEACWRCDICNCSFTLSCTQLTHACVRNACVA